MPLGRPIDHKPPPRTTTSSANARCRAGCTELVDEQLQRDYHSYLIMMIRFNLILFNLINENMIYKDLFLHEIHNPHL